MRPLPLIAVAVLPGCFPIVTHPTRVEQGFHMSFAGSAMFLRDSAISATAPNGIVVPSFDLDMSLHIRDSIRPTSTGVRLAAEFGMSGVGGSLYAEFPRNWLGDLDAGIGYQRRIGYVKTHSIYAQVGSGTSRSWFIRNGLTWMTGYDTPRRVVWIPVIGRSRTSGNRQLMLYAGGIVGAQVPATYGCPNFDCSDTPNGFASTHLVIGLAVSGQLLR